jgi:AcrR family transcriptional regulator
VSELRARILENARRLIIEQGYDGLSMRQIAEAVEVSKAALYYHFRDKEQLLQAILDDDLDQIADLLTQIQQQSGDTREQIRLFIENVLGQPVERRAAIRLASQEAPRLSEPARSAFFKAYHERFIQRLQDMLQSGVQRGELRPLPPSVAVWALLGMLYPYFYAAHQGETVQAGEVTGYLAQIFLEGISNPPRSSHFNKAPP